MFMKCTLHEGIQNVKKLNNLENEIPTNIFNAKSFTAKT
jgi:hypothetical protein